MMANYAEQLAYWYLRLNGFFLIQNYVYHQIQEEDEDRGHNADADLLAIRPPYYYEEIPHREEDENGQVQYLRAPLESDDWLNDFKGKWLGAIVEVKGSDQARLDRVNRAFTPGRLEVSLNRLGLPIRTEDALSVLSGAVRIDFEKVSILKILFSQNKLEGLWMNILLDEADEFIINRMTSAQTYLAKTGSRYFFPSELIQYMIWSSNKPRR
jgi:hypothetical protein